MSNAMHSTPIYQNFSEIRQTATSYLIVVEGNDADAIAQIQEHIDSNISTQILKSSAITEETLTVFKQELVQFISSVQAGLHSIIYGSEVFIWQVQNILVQLGCLSDEISLIQANNQQQKQVYCVHCGHLQHTQEVEFCHCEACKVYLFIRSHFSQRLGAYMGVCANAHQPMGSAS